MMRSIMWVLCITLYAPCASLHGTMQQYSGAAEESISIANNQVLPTFLWTESMVRRLLARHEANQPISVDELDCDGNTALLFAAFIGNSAYVTQLIAAHADITCRDGIGLTPLMVATIGGHVLVAELLIQAGADVDDVNSFGWNVLGLAVSNRKKSIVQLLLDHGANRQMNITTGPHQGFKTALTIAQECGYSDIEMLFARKDEESDQLQLNDMSDEDGGTTVEDGCELPMHEEYKSAAISAQDSNQSTESAVE